MHIPDLTINTRLPVDDPILLPGAIIVEAETSKKINGIAMQQLAQLQIESGTFFLEDGSKYTGQHQNNVPHGQGTLYYPVGNKDNRFSYVGRFENGSPQGKGKIEWINGDSFDGFVENGQLKEGTLTYAPSNYFPEHPRASFTGTFYDGQHFLTGEFQYTTIDGQSVVKHYKDSRDRGIKDPVTGKYSNECCGIVCVIL